MSDSPEAQRLPSLPSSVFESIVANATDAIVVTEARPIDPPGPRILYVNPAFESMTGFTQEEVLGQSPRILQGPGSDRQCLREIREALTRFSPVRTEVLNYRKDGTPYWAELSIQPFNRDPQTGEYRNFMAMQRDITAKRVERGRLALRDRLYSAMASGMAMGDVLQQITAGVAQLLPQSHTAIYLPTSDRSQLDTAIVDPALHRVAGAVVQRGARPRTPCYEAYMSDTPVLMGPDTLREEYPSYWEVLESCGFGSVCVCPVSSVEGPRGVLAVYLPKELKPPPDLDSALEPIAGLVEVVLQRTEVRESQRRQEARLRSVFELTPTGNFITSTSGRVLDCNKTLARMLGYSSPADLLRGSAVRLPPESSVRERFFDDLITQERLEGFEFDVLRRDGGRIRVAAHVAARRDSQGKFVGALGFLVDITSQRAAELALRESEERFRVLADQCPAMVWMADERWELTYLNRYGIEFLGVPAEALREARWHQFIHKEDREQLLKALARASERRHALRIELRVRRADGSWRWLLTSGMPRLDQVGRLQGFIGVSFDLTELKEAESDRRRRDQQLQETQRLESLGLLAGGIAHDFNNLLMGIQGNVGLAMLEPGSPNAKLALARAELAVQRASDLTNQLLAYAGHRKPRLQPLSVSALVKEMADLLSTSVRKEARFVLQLDERVPSVIGDPSQLRQVVMNLITNASDAVAGTEGLIELRVRAGRLEGDRGGETASLGGLPDGDYTVIEVRDNGCGMPPEVMTRIYEPFFTTKRFAGRGLGLSAVQGILRSHGGAITVGSEVGRGSTFAVYLPASNEAPQAMDGRRRDGTTWRGSGTILVVDDEESVRSVASQILQRFGFRTLLAGDGREGLELFTVNRSRVVLILLDLKMPVMSGEELLPVLRELAPNVPLLLTSGYHETDVTGLLKDHQALGFIQKPYRPLELVGRVRELLEGVADAR